MDVNLGSDLVLFFKKVTCTNVIVLAYLLEMMVAFSNIEAKVIQQQNNYTNGTNPGNFDLCF